MCWRDKERKREREKEVTEVQLFTEKVHLRSSFLCFVWRHSLYNVSRELSFVSSSLPSFGAPFLPQLDFRLFKLSPKLVQDSQAEKKIQTVTGMLDSGSKQTLIGFSCPEKRHSPGPTCSFLNTRKTTAIHNDEAWRAALGKWKYFLRKVQLTPDSETFLLLAPHIWVWRGCPGGV